jgi:hypothetical protein
MCASCDATTTTIIIILIILILITLVLILILTAAGAPLLSWHSARHGGAVDGISKHGISHSARVVARGRS